MEEFKDILKQNGLKKVQIAKGRSPDYGTYEARLAANHLLKEIAKGEKDYLKPSLIYALSSIVEGKLNSCFIDFCFDKFGDDYKSYSKSYLKMSIHDKLNIVIPLISDYKLNLNHEKVDLQRIRKVIDFRNQLIHIKPHYTTYMFSVTEENEMYEQDVFEQELGIYHDIKFEQLETEFLNDCFTSIHSFNLRFTNLSRKINYKNFKVTDWFVPIKIKKTKLTVKSS